MKNEVILRLESFLAAFERVAATPEQQELVREFGQFIEDLGGVRLTDKRQMSIEFGKILHGEGKVEPRQSMGGM
jgi:hypothetical protein